MILLEEAVYGELLCSLFFLFTLSFLFEVIMNLIQHQKSPRMCGYF